MQCKTLLLPVIVASVLHNFRYILIILLFFIKTAFAKLSNFVLKSSMWSFLHRKLLAVAVICFLIKLNNWLSYFHCRASSPVSTVRWSTVTESRSSWRMEPPWPTTSTTPSRPTPTATRGTSPSVSVLASATTASPSISGMT